MRVSVFLILIFTVFALFLWTTLSGALFLVGCLIWLFSLIITIGYSDKAILFFLGAREVRSSDEALFFQAAAQEAYKLSVSVPHLYFYNGTLERGFILQNNKTLSLVLSKSLLENTLEPELSAICFELLLQTKKSMALKRTKVMFVLGSLAWFAHSIVALLSIIIPFKNVIRAADWFLNYLLHPWLDLLFKITLGQGYFAKLKNMISEFPHEEAMISRLGYKLRRPREIYSLPSRKMMEFTGGGRSRHFQNILALEFLPHEWDFLFNEEGLNRVK